MIEAAIAAAVDAAISPLVEEVRQLRAAIEAQRAVEWLPTAEAARRLGISRRALDARRRRGLVEAKRDGGRWLFVVEP